MIPLRQAEQSGHKLIWGGGTAADQVIYDRCGDCPDAEEAESHAPKTQKRTQTSGGGERETLGKTGKVGNTES